MITMDTGESMVSKILARRLLRRVGPGVHPFCITIDRAAREYLPHMYGEASYTLVSEVNKLPDKVSEIYRRLTT